MFNHLAPKVHIHLSFYYIKSHFVSSKTDLLNFESILPSLEYGILGVKLISCYLVSSKNKPVNFKLITLPLSSLFTVGILQNG